MPTHLGAQPIVLSADDDENAQLLLKRAFNKTGIKAALVTVRDGSEAIQYLAREGEFADREIYPPATLLLLDVKMPRVNGFEVLQYIRKQHALQNLPVVMFSSSGTPADVQRAYELGCHSYVVKPTGFDDLLRLVTALAAEFLVLVKSHDSGFSKFVVSPEGFYSPVAKQTVPVKKFFEVPESMFRVLVEQVNDYAVFVLDTDGFVRSWNEGGRRLNGYEPHEIIGQHFSRFYPKQDVDNDKPSSELRLATEMGRYEDEGWRVRNDGSRFWANVVITPLRDSDGILSGFAKVTRDLTQRKFQEESLQKLLESEERFRLLVEQVRDYAIFILDAKGNVASWNQGARRLKGYTSEEIIGRHFSTFYGPQDIAAEKPTRELSIAIRDGRYEEEGWRIRKDGSRFWASVVITALWDRRGNLSGFAKVTRDLTDKKREEDALRQKTEELEAFAHTLSHDLRAPLRSISSFAQLLRQDALEISETERTEYLDKIFRAAQSMDGLITDILKLSQLSLAPAPDHPVSLDQVIADCVRLLELEIKESHAEIKVISPLPEVHANRTLLFQIFSNLIGNAIKFARPGSKPEVEIFSVVMSGNCEIHIKDHGVGIPEKYQQTVFKMFERGDAAATVSGSGLGLAIVRRAADRLGGSVRVSSKEGAGSDFIVTLDCSVPTSAVAGQT